MDAKIYKPRKMSISIMYAHGRPHIQSKEHVNMYARERQNTQTKEDVNIHIYIINIYIYIYITQIFYTYYNTYKKMQE